MSLPQPVPPIARPDIYHKDLPLSAPLGWLAAGWRDLLVKPGPSLLYGLGVTIISLALVGGILTAGYDYILLPALSAFIVAAPLLAVGLYEKSRRLMKGEPMNFTNMLFVKAKSPGQVWYIGALLALLAMMWVRVSVLIYAFFFGLNPFPGMDHLFQMLFYTPRGWTMILVGSFIGAHFAAFSFAISFLAIPMLLDKEVDAFTAMGESMAIAWSNKAVTFVWGAIIVALCVFAMLTAFVGLIFIFPLLGHATWHAYQAYQDVT